MKSWLKKWVWSGWSCRGVADLAKKERSGKGSAGFGARGRACCVPGFRCSWIGILSRRYQTRLLSMAENPQITEDGLDALREKAARTGKVQDHGIVPVGSPFPKPASAMSYHGNPVLKPPTWTWQVPLYFFVGGVAGISAVIALVAHLFGNAGLIRAGLWVGFAGALISAPLLIADLGRPARFLNMLRVFKLRSAMSVGAWTLSGF